MARVSDYLYRKASVNKIPLNGCFELSPVCNFSCRMCYVRKTVSQIHQEGREIIGWKQWLALAEECYKEGTLYLLLTGGEPFFIHILKNCTSGSTRWDLFYLLIQTDI